MKRYLPFILALLIFIVGVGTTVLASDTSDAIWSGIARVTNNSTAATGVSVPFTANTSVYIAGGYMYSSGNNTAVQFSGADVAYMPGYTGNPWVIFQGAIGASTILDGTLYMGGTTDMAAKLRWFPNTTGGTVADSASLEPSANFSHSISGYFLNSGTFFEKAVALKYTYDSTTNNITAGILTANITQVTLDTDRPLGNATVIRTGERFNSFPISTIESVSFNMLKTGAPTGTLTVRVRKVSDDSVIGTMGSIDVATALPATYTFYGDVQNTVVQDIRIQAEYSGGNAGNYVRFETKAGGSTYAGGVYTSYIAAYTDSAAEDAYFDLASSLIKLATTGVSAGEHDIIIAENDTLFSISVDGVVTANTTGNVTVTNNANSWVMGQNSVMPYIESIGMSVGGTQKGSWNWEYAANFTDDSGNGNTMTPSFRTTSSDADVSAALVGFGPIEEADAPPYTVSDPPDLITANISVSGGFTSNTTGSSVPGVDVITAVAAASGTPVPFILYLIAGVALLGLSMGVSYLMRDGGSTSLVIKILIILGALGVLIAIDIFDDWVLYLFAMLAIGIAFIASNRQFEGTGNFNNNLLGFLIMAWLGMSVINNILEGVILTTTERSMMNNFLIFQPWNIAGLFTLPVPSISFLTVGLPALMEWDYTAFGGNAQIFTYLMYSITGVVAFLFFTVAMASAANMFFRSR